MKKEVLIAIIIGFVLGLIITFGIWTANRALKAPPEEVEEPTPVLSPSPTVSPLFLEITAPEDNSISEEEEVELSGKTVPEAVVVVLYLEGEKIIQADEEGNFSTEITLVGGANDVTVTAYDLEGDEASQTLTIIYSTAEI